MILHSTTGMSHLKRLVYIYRENLNICKWRKC